MKSSFNGTRKSSIRSSSVRQEDEVYDLAGLNQVAPDQVMPPGDSPNNENARSYAREESETRVAIRTRKGSELFSTPVGKAASTENVATSTGDIEFSGDTQIFQAWTSDADGVLTDIEPHIKKVTSGNGPVIIEIYSDNSGAVGTLIGQTSILPSAISASYDYISAHIMDAPTVENGTDYWMLYKVQDDGTGSYALNKTAGAGASSSTDNRVTTTSLLATFRYKTYVSTAGEILGFARRYPQNKQNRTYFAMNNDVYEVNSAGVSTSISSAIHASAEYWRTAQVDDKLMWVDGNNTAKWYDGTTVSEINNVSGNPTHVIIYKNRAFFVPDSDPTRVNYSGLYDFESYSSVNFFYVPNPKSPDHIAGWTVFQDALHIFTHETKHIIYGSSISTFERKEAIGTKGAVSQEAIATDRNYIYFMADDGQIYRYNGSSDELISGKIEPEINSIQNKKKVRFHIYRNQLRVYYSKKPNVTVEYMLIYDIDTERWFKDTGRTVLGSLEWYLDDNELIEFNSRAGVLYKGELGGSDAGKAIDFKYWTAYKNYGSGASKDRVRKFRPFVRPSSVPYNLMVGKDVNFENKPVMKETLVDSGGAKWGNFSWGDGTKWGSGKNLVDDAVPMSGRGNHTQYRFEKSGVETPVELYGYIAIIKSGRRR